MDGVVPVKGCDIADEIGRFDTQTPVDMASMPPASWYVEPAFYRLEVARVFCRAWHPVVRVDQVGKNGAYVSGSLPGLLWLVLRDHEGELRAFHNVCRHKAAELLSGEGILGEEIVCPYHAWSYRPDGCLRRATNAGAMTGFDRHTAGLKPLRLAVWGPYVFVCADDSVPALRDQVTEMDVLLEESGWHGLRWVRRRAYSIACNWKVFVDNYLDGGYHVPYVHPSLHGQLEMSGYETRLHRHSVVQLCSVTQQPTGEDVLSATERIGDGAVYGWLHPLFMFNRYGPVLDTHIVIPRGPDRTEVIFDFFFDPEVDDAFIEASIAQSHVTQEEDIRISESVQRGLVSGAYTPGRYSPRWEKGEHFFHRLLASEYLGNS